MSKTRLRPNHNHKFFGTPNLITFPDYISGQDDIILQQLIRDAREKYRNLILSDDDIYNIPGQHIKSGADHGLSFGFPVSPNDVIHDLGNTWDARAAVNKWNQQRTNSRTNNSSPYTLDTYLKEVAKFINAKKEQLGKQPVASYPTKNPPMSVLQQQVREAREKKWGKSEHYQKKRENLLERARAEPGFAPGQIEEILDYLQTTGHANVKRIAKKYLDNEFVDNYRDRGDILSKILAESLQNKSNVKEASLDQLSREIGLTQGESDRALHDLMGKLGENKKANLENIIKQKELIANQEHTYGGLEDQVLKKIHDMEIAGTYKRVNDLEHGFNNLYMESGNPDAGRKAMETGSKLLANFGINGLSSIPNAKELFAKESPQHLNFTADEFLEPLPDEIETSKLNLTQIDPKLRDSESYKTKKTIIKDIYGTNKKRFPDAIKKELRNKTIGNIAFNNAKEAFDENLVDLDADLDDVIEKTMNRLGHKYMRRRAYGSPQHIRESEKIVGDLTKDYNEKRYERIFNKLNTEFGNETRRLEAGRNNLARADQLVSNSLNKILQDNKELNDLGAGKWYNNQYERNNKIENKIKELGLSNNIIFPQGYFSEMLNPNYRKDFDTKMREYLSNEPFSKLDTPKFIDINRLNYIAPFSEKEKIRDDNVLDSKLYPIRKSEDYTFINNRNLGFAKIIIAILEKS